MPTLGQTLRAEREKRGLTIADVAAQTRIQAQYFEAIEKDDTSSLPGGFFYRSFVRQYARLLELPVEQYERELERHLSDEQSTIAAQPSSLPEKPLSVPPMPTGGANPAEETRRWLLRLGGLAIVILLCSLLYTVSLNWKTWFSGIMPATSPEPPVAQVPVKQSQPEPATTPAPSPVTETPTEPQPGTPPPTADASKPAETQVPPSQSAEVTQPAATQPQTQAQAPPAQTPPAGAVTVTIKAIDQAWVQVRDGGKVVYSNVIPVGETRTFASTGKLRVLFGNAGGVEVTHNGKPLAAPGPKGQVRTVEYSTTGAETIVKPPAPPA